MSHGKAVAAGAPADLVAEHAGREVVEVYGPPTGSQRSSPRRARPAEDAPHRHERLVLGDDGARPGYEGERRPRISRTCSCCSPARRSADGHRGAHRAIGRLERSAIAGVLVREVINFSSYWRAATFSSTVEPTIYLVAFGFGFGSLVSTIDGYSYVEFVGTGTVAMAVLFSSAFPAMFGTFVKYKFQRTYDAMLAAPVDTEELVTAESLWIAVRAGVYGCVPMIVSMFFGLDPPWAMLVVPFIGFLTAARLGLLRDHDRRLREVDRELQLHRQRRPDAALPARRHVLSARRAAQVAAGARRGEPAPPVRRARARSGAFGFEWDDLLRVGRARRVRALIWRVAIFAMQRKLID